MINATSRLAVKITHLPDSVNWDDVEPQRSRQSLTIDDFLPSDQDGVALQEHATRYVMEFLVSQFPSLKSLKKFVPARESPHPVQKSVVAPMKILFKDEKYKSETIEILQQLMADANLQGSHQVQYLESIIVIHCLTMSCLQIVVGDQLTCKVIRGCKHWVQVEPEAKNKLLWVNETPGNSKLIHSWCVHLQCIYSNK